MSSENKSMGRPKEKINIPVFRNDKDIINFLVDLEAKLCMRLTNNALKTNDIKKDNFKLKKVKNEQIKLALDSIKLLKGLLETKYIIDKKIDNDMLMNSRVKGLNNDSEANDNINDFDSVINKELSDLRGLLNGF